MPKNTPPFDNLSQMQNWRRLKMYEVKDRPAELPADIPEHWHVTYEGVPDFKRIFLKSSDAYWEVKLLGEKSEPNTEWYEDGRVMIETRLHDRTGLHKVILEVVACTRRACRARITGEEN